MADMTEVERKVLRHTLGLDRAKEPYRNYFCAGPGHHDLDTIGDLIALGFMRRAHTINNGRDVIYTITDAGRRALNEGE